MATTKDFIRVCNNITLDGQITGDEVYHLAQWLNDHLELCEEWPCNLIFEPLHKVWEDGKVDEAELALVGRILVEIERQWAQRHGSKPATARAATLDDRVPTTQALAPEPSVHPVVRLPPIDFHDWVESEASRSLVYKVNLEILNCTCKDFFDTRRRAPDNHVSRCCRHIVALYYKKAWELDYDPAKPHNRVHPPIHPIAWEILTNARSRGNGTDPLLHYTLAHVDGAEVLLGYKGGDWVEVYAKNGDDHYQRFGFNLGLERWSYSVAPEAEYLISAVIAQKYPTPTA